MLILRTCNADMTSYGGFRWPESGPVEALDWSAEPQCGNGLHGLLWGCGDARLLIDDPKAKWLVAEIDEYVDLGGKIKFRRANVVFCGDRDGAIAYLDAHGAADKPVVFAQRIGGDWATVTGGDMATVTGGYAATVTGGYGATVTGGDRATVTGGDRATVTGGDRATVTGGYGATVTGGDRATLILHWSDTVRKRIAVGYVGEGLKAGVAYKLYGAGEFVEAKC